MLIHQDATSETCEYWVDLDKIDFIKKIIDDDGTIEYKIYLIGLTSTITATEETVQKILKEKGVT